MYGILRTVDATVEPISVKLAKEHCRVLTDDDDSLLGLYITAARQYCEEVTGRAFLQQTWQLTLDRFPGTFAPGGVTGSGTLWPGYGGARIHRPGQPYWQQPEILLPRPRLIAVTSITYLDPTNASQTLPTSSYLVDAGIEPAKVILAPGQYWPATLPFVSGAVQITYTAGYGTAATAVPVPLQLAILMLVAHWYENREATVLPDSGTGVVSVPLGLTDMLAAYTLDAFTLEN